MSRKEPEDLEALKRMHLPTYEEIYEKSYRRIGNIIAGIKKKKGSNPREDALAIINTAFNIIKSKLSAYDKFYKMVKSNETVKTYLSIVLGDEAFDKLEKGAFLSKKLSQIYSLVKIEIMTGEQRNLRDLGIRGASRLLSLVKRNKKLLNEILEVKKEVMLIPGPNELPSIIVTGPPNSGKSTLVQKISETKTEVADYPFTTKRITPGRFLDEGRFNIIVLDTPGILLREREQMNVIERRALAALKVFNGVALFVIDPSAQSTMSLEEQLELLKKVRGEVFNLIVVVNKIDLLSEEEIKKLKQTITRSGLSEKEVYFISALNNINVGELSKALKDTLLASLKKESEMVGNGRR